LLISGCTAQDYIRQCWHFGAWAFVQLLLLAAAAAAEATTGPAHMPFLGNAASYIVACCCNNSYSYNAYVWLDDDDNDGDGALGV
jgi:P pilus assembly chaperone PapD